MMEAMMHYTPEGGIQHNIEFSEGLAIVSAPIVGNPLYEHPPAIADDLVNVDLFSQPDGLKYHEESTQGLQHFFSSTLSEGCTSPSTSSEMMSTADCPFSYAPSSRSSVSSSHVCGPHSPRIYILLKFVKDIPFAPFCIHTWPLHQSRRTGDVERVQPNGGSWRQTKSSRDTNLYTETS